jgi:hypothetical protein
VTLAAGLGHGADTLASIVEEATSVADDWT